MFDRIARGLWWDKPLSLVEGCTPCSPGCDNCWLRSMDRRFKRPEGVRFRSDRLTLPASRKKPTAWAIWSDLLHEDVVPSDLHAALGMFLHVPRHRYLLLTKRAHRLHLLTHFYRAGVFPPWLWVGITVCDQDEADEKIPMLLQVPAAVRFLSVEPMLGAIDMRSAAFNGADTLESLEGIHWVIAAGESGHGARPSHPDWFRSLRDQCQVADVPFVFKQWGEWGPGRPWLSAINDDPGTAAIHRWPTWTGPHPELSYRWGKKAAGRLLDGAEYLQLPDDHLEWKQPGGTSLYEVCPGAPRGMVRLSTDPLYDTDPPRAGDRP